MWVKTWWREGGEGREGDHLCFGFLILFEQKEQEDESAPFGFITPYNPINLLFKIPKKPIINNTIIYYCLQTSQLSYFSPKTNQCPLDSMINKQNQTCAFKIPIKPKKKQKKQTNVLIKTVFTWPVFTFWKYQFLFVCYMWGRVGGHRVKRTKKNPPTGSCPIPGDSALPPLTLG